MVVSGGRFLSPRDAKGLRIDTQMRKRGMIQGADGLNRNLAREVVGNCNRFLVVIVEGENEVLQEGIYTLDTAFCSF